MGRVDIWLWSTSDIDMQSWNAASFIVFFRADGACQHVAAALYAADDQAVKSVTDGPTVWVHRNTTCEEAKKMNNLPHIQAKYAIVILYPQKNVVWYFAQLK